MWITIEMPSTTPRHVTSHGRSPAALHGAARQPREGTLGVVGVDGGERAAVAGVEGLQEVGGLAPAHLPDDDVIGPVAQVRDFTRSRMVTAPVLEPARLEPDAVRGVDPQLERVLDGHDPLVVGE